MSIFSSARVGRKAVVLLSTVLAAVMAAGPAVSEDGGPKADPALEAYHLANAAYNRRLYPVAVTQFEAFLRQHGNHPKAGLARYGLGLSQYALRQYDAASKQFAAVLAARPPVDGVDRGQVVLLQAQCMLRSGRQKEALAFLGPEATKLSDAGRKVAAASLAADLCFQLGQWEDVLIWAGRVIDGKPQAEPRLRALYQQGVAHLRLDQAEPAAGVLGRALADAGEGPWRTRVAYQLGEARTKLGRHAEAEAAFLAALPGLEGADAVTCRYRVGLARFRQEKHAEACGDFQACLKEDPKGPLARPAQFHLGRSRLALNDYGQAEQMLAAVAGGDDELAVSANLWLARVYTRRSGDHDRAAQVLTAAVKRFGRSPGINALAFDAANALMSRREPDWAAAADLFRQVDRRGGFGQMPELLSQWAVALHRQADYAGSLKLCDRFDATAGGAALAGDVALLRGENLYLLGKPAEADKVLADFIAAYRDHHGVPGAWYRRMEIAYGAQRWTDALAAADALDALTWPEGSKPPARLPFLVGACRFRLGQWGPCAGPLKTFVDGHRQRGKVAAAVDVDTALMMLAVAAEREGQVAEAIGHLRAITEAFAADSPQVPAAWAEMGRLQYQSGDPAGARKSLERFLAEYGRNRAFQQHGAAHLPRAEYYLGWVFAGGQDHAGAASHFAAVLRADPKHALAPDAALQQAVALVNGGDFATAGRTLRDLAKRFPDHENAAMLAFYLGLAQARQAMWGPAAEQLKRMIQRHGDSPLVEQALYELAWCERSLDRKDQAIEAYRTYLERFPSGSLALKVQSELAELDLDRGDHDQVIARLTGSLASIRDPALRAEVSYQLASAQFRKKDFASAAAGFEALARDPHLDKLRGSILFHAGESRLNMQETQRARDHFAAASRSPGVEGALAESILMRLGETQTLLGDFRQAMQAYDQFLKKYPASRWARQARFGLGFARENSGDPAGAIREYEVVLKDQTVDLWAVRARFQLGECLFNQKRYEEAATEFVRMEVSYGGYPAWQAKAGLELGRMLIAQEKRDEAAERLKDVIRRYGDQKAAVVAKQLLDELRRQ